MAVSTTILGNRFMGLPSGTTAERPASPQEGYMWYNTTLGVVEAYHSAFGDDGAKWITLTKTS